MMLFGDPSLRLGIGGVEVSPMRLEFGSLMVGQVKSLQVNIHNMNGSNLTISDINLSDPENYTLWPLPETPMLVPPGESRTLTVTFMPQEKATYAANLTIVSDDLKTPIVNVELYGESEWMFDYQFQPELVQVNYLDTIYDHWEQFFVERYMDPMKVSIDWPTTRATAATTEVKLTIYDPKGRVYTTVSSATAPITVDVSAAKSGGWKFKMQPSKIVHKNHPVLLTIYTPAVTGHPPSKSWAK
jgi:hypothetical protein